jgi:hypothetical protein
MAGAIRMPAVLLNSVEEATRAVFLILISTNEDSNETPGARSNKLTVGESIGIY